MSNKAVIHQIHFLPWLPYMAKIYSSDIFIILDNINYKPRYFLNRTKICVNKSLNWFTIPVKQGSQNKKTKEIFVLKDYNYKKNIDFIYNLYKKNKNYILIEPYISYMYDNENIKLIDFNLGLINIFFEQLKVKKSKILLSSNLINKQTNIVDRTDRKIFLCKKTKSNILINGFGGSLKVHDLNKIKSNHIKIYYIKEKILYNKYQLYKKYTGLSFINNLLLFGLEHTKQELINLSKLYNEEF